VASGHSILRMPVAASQRITGVVYGDGKSATPPASHHRTVLTLTEPPPARAREWEALEGSSARCTILLVAKSPGTLVREFCKKHRICTHCFHRRALRGVTRCEPCVDEMQDRIHEVCSEYLIEAKVGKVEVFSSLALSISF